MTIPLLRARARTTTSAAALLTLAFAPAAAAEPTPADPAASPTTTTTSATDDPFDYTPAPGAPATDESLGGEELQSQVAEAEALTDKILAGDDEISAAVRELNGYSKRANTLLQRYSKARTAHAKAKEEADEARAQSKALSARLADGRRDLRDWAFGTYTEAGGYTDTMAFLNIMTKEPDEAGDSAGDLSYLTDERIHSVDLVRIETALQAELTRKRVKAERRAEAQKTQADKARKELAAVIEDRKAALDALRQDYAEQLKDAGPLVQSLLGLASPDAQRAQEALTSAMEEAGQDVSSFEAGKPCSDNEGSYPNGQVPPSAMCPLIGSSGETLRPKAAAAFNAMTKAYARDTGRPLCVTDSYRSYAEQVIVKGERGGWAAAPGTSNHGLGLALDLCGGVNSFGHPAHAWMQQNAPMYGWFHPSWAGAGGSLPEPWHWEFAG